MAVVGLAGFVCLASVPASAHEHVTVGAYEFTVGWRDEPAVAGVLNGLDLGIAQHRSNGTIVMVVGVEGNLTAVLSTGPASLTKALAPQFGRPGWYTFDVIPTRAGTYHVRLLGTLNTTRIDANVTLDGVALASDLAFPLPDPTPSELQSRIDAANAQIGALQSQLTLAVGIGAVGVVLALATLFAYIRVSRRSRKPE